jgi:hypothetical protein
MDAYPCVYHRNFYTELRLHEDVLSMYPGKKTKVKKLEYILRKTTICIAMCTLNKNPLHLKKCIIHKSVSDA